jgi:hypothetical protein
MWVCEVEGRKSNLTFEIIHHIWDQYMTEIKVNLGHYRPGQAHRVPGGWGSQIYRQSAHEGGKVVSPTHRLPLPPRKYSWCSFLLQAESTPGPQCGRKDYVNEKMPMTPSGIEPANFRLVAQCDLLLFNSWYSCTGTVCGGTTICIWKTLKLLKKNGVLSRKW